MNFLKQQKQPLEVFCKKNLQILLKVHSNKGVFHVKIAKHFRTPILKNICVNDCFLNRHILKSTRRAAAFDPY